MTQGSLGTRRLAEASIGDNRRMSNRQPVPLAQAYLLLNHGPVTLVTSAHAGRRNVMAAAWAMPLDFAPPKVLLVIDKATLTRELVDASGEFALNIPPRALAGQTLAAGSASGRDGDKFADLGLACFAGERIAAPLLADCVAWLECRVIAEPRNEKTYDLFIAEVVAAHADARVFAGGRWRFDAAPLRTMHYQSGGAFFATGAAFTVGDPGA